MQSRRLGQSPTSTAIRSSPWVASPSSATSTSCTWSFPLGVTWPFFYGTVNFDAVIGTLNHYCDVDLFAGRFNEAYRRAELDYSVNFPHDEIKATFQAILADWVNEELD